MKILYQAATLGFLMAVCLAPDAGGSGPAPSKKTDDVLLSSMERELQRAHDQLGKLDPPAYFMSYSVHDQSQAVAIGSQGSLLNSTHTRTRTADVVIRVGSPALDNSHETNRSSAISSGELPLDNDADAVAHELWQLTYGEYRKASKAYLNVKTSTEVNAKEEDTSPDFSTESPQVHCGLQRAAALSGPGAVGTDGAQVFGALPQVPVHLSFRSFGDGGGYPAALCFQRGQPRSGSVEPGETRDSGGNPGG